MGRSLATSFGLVSACLLSLCATPRAQAPAHATPLFPIQLSEQPLLYADEDFVHAAHWNGSALSVRHSHDGGRTWLPQSGGVAAFQHMAASGAVLAAVGIPDPYLPTSGPVVAATADAGLTWSSTQVATLSSPPVGFAFPAARVFAHGPVVGAVWLEPATGELWCRRSLDGGQTWPAAEVLVEQVAPSALFGVLEVVADGPDVYVFWMLPNFGVSGALLQVSHDAGATWLPASRAIPTLDAQRLQPTVAAGALFASFDGVRLYRSVDDGITWTQVAPLSASGFVDGLAAEGTRVLAAQVEPAGVNSLWQVTASTDGGATWIDPPVQISTGPWFGASAQIVGSDFFLLLANGQDPASSALLRSSDDGQTWSVLQYDVNALLAGERRTVVARYGPSGQAGVGILEAYVSHGWTPLGSGTPGTSGLTPELAMTGAPFAGQTVDLQLSDCRAGGFGVVGVTWEDPVALPLFGGVLRLAAPLLPVSFVADAAGAATVPLAVPSSPAVAGESLVAQGFTLDAAATGGVALTRAIEVWLR